MINTNPIQVIFPILLMIAVAASIYDFTKFNFSAFQRIANLNIFDDLRLRVCLLVAVVPVTFFSLISVYCLFEYFEISGNSLLPLFLVTSLVIMPYLGSLVGLYIWRLTYYFNPKKWYIVRTTFIEYIPVKPCVLRLLKKILYSHPQ